MTGWIRATAIALVVFIFASACVPRSQFDQVSSDLQDAQATIQELQSELDSLQEEAQATIQQLQGELDSAQGEADALRAILAQAQGFPHVLYQAVVAATTIPPGTRIEDTMVVLVPYPGDLVFETMILDTAEAVGRTARVEIVRGMILTTGLLTDE